MEPPPFSTTCSGGTRMAPEPSPTDILLKRLRTEIKVTIGPKSYTYLKYFDLADSKRSGDEASFVDSNFSRVILSWLGWEPGNVRYNAPEPGHGKSTQRPDFRVLSSGATAFILEDKNTTENWSVDFLPQLRKYVSGTLGLALWTNGRELRLFRFSPDGSAITIAISDVLGLAKQPTEVVPVNRDALNVIHDLLHRDRYEDFDGLSDLAAGDDPRIPLTNDHGILEFISGSQDVLARLGRVAASQVRASQATGEADRISEMAILKEVKYINQIFLDQLPPPARTVYEPHVTLASSHLGSVCTSDLDLSRLPTLPAKLVSAREQWTTDLQNLDTKWRLLELNRKSHSKIVDAFTLWQRRQPDTESDSITADRFSEQVVYVVFVRLLLIRILEDKSILPNRIIANGGFDAWRSLIRDRFTPYTTHSKTIFGAELLALLNRAVSEYYGHFFDQPIFDWFEPDDFSLVRLLAHFNKYDFSVINADVIGFTYETYIDRSNKKSKGQFLTRPGLVEYLLDRANYLGPVIIGKRVLDHACGSGSFLIHSVRRLRQALVEGLCSTTPGSTTDEFLEGHGARRVEFCNQFLQLVGRDIVGMDIDPFACYLAELNLLVQVLSEMAYLWKNGMESPIRRFLVFNSNGLQMPESVLGAASGDTPLQVDTDAQNPLDDGWTLKGLHGDHSVRFDFVFANPPFVSSKKQPTVAQVALRRFFSEDAISGDTNTYLCFLRLAEYYLANNGRAFVIVPVQLCGDDSSEKIRRFLTARRCRVIHLTRFTSATVLFPNVDQWMMIVGFSVGDPLRPAPTIELMQGMTEKDASLDSCVQAAPAVINATPTITSINLIEKWKNPWLCVADQNAFDVWNTIQTISGSFLADLFVGKTNWKQGDVNTYAVKSLRTKTPTSSSLPTFSGSAAGLYAPLAKPDSWVTTPSTTSATDPGKTLYELSHLTATEEGFIIPVQSNLHVARRIHGTWYKRESSNSFVALHSLWRIRALTGHERHVMGLLGLLNSSLINYLFSLWSTNMNISQGLILRIPCPPFSTFPFEEIASQVERALKTRSDIETMIGGTNGSYVRGSIKLDYAAILAAKAIPGVTLNEAVLSASLSLSPGRAMKIESILAEERLTSAVPEYVEAIRPLLAPFGEKQWDVVKNTVRIPRSDQLGEWTAVMEESRNASDLLLDGFSTTTKTIDEIVFDWYQVTDERLKATAIKGVPWAYKNARSRRKELLPSESTEIDDLIEEESDCDEALQDP